MKVAITFLAHLVIPAVMAAPVTIKENQLKVVEVSIETPLPTGLESVEGAKADANALYAAIVKHPTVKPYVAATEVLHKHKLKDADKYGAHARVAIDCKKHPISYGDEDKNFCAITTSKSYGWYADLALVFTIRGFIHKDLVE